MNLLDYIRTKQPQLTNGLLKWVFSVGLLSFTLTACFQKKYDYEYTTYLVNSTSEQISLKIYIKGNTYRDIDISMNDTLDGGESRLGGFGLNSEIDNPTKYFFTKSEVPFDSVQIFRNDTLKCEWVAPAYEGEVNDNNFFNINAWKQWLIDDEQGVIMFTIYPEDLKLNNK